MRRLLFLIAILLLVTLPVYAGEEVPRFEEGDCPFEIPEGFDPECGILIVPEDRTIDDSPTIELAIAVFPAQDDDADNAPLVYLDGGPGGSSLDSWGGGFDTSFAVYNEEHDVVLLDQRGTGFSQPSLFCEETLDYIFDTLDDALSDEESTDGYWSALNDCRDRLVDDGVNLSAYNSAEMAADINDLADALGYDEVNLLGISYGTRIALTVMRDFPDIVRSAIIDAVVPPQLDSHDEDLVTFSRVFDELFAECEADEGCNENYPDLEETLYFTAAELEENPVMLQVEVDETGETYDLLFDGDALFSTILQSFYATFLVPKLPMLIYDVAKGDYDFAAFLNGAFLDSGYSISEGVYFSVHCREEVPFNDLDDQIENAEQFPELAQYLGSEDDVSERAFFENCEDWGGGVADDIEDEAVESDIPTLVLNGQFDPVTPPEWGEIAAETLENSFVFTFPSFGHGASLESNDCPIGIVLAFIEDPEEEPDGSCIEDIELVFELPITSIDLTDFSTDTFEVSGVVPQGWEPAADDLDFIYVSPESQSVAIYYLAGPESDDYLGFIIEFFGNEEIPDEFETLDVNDRDWTTYRYHSDTYLDYIMLGVTEERGIQYLIVVTSRNQREQVFLYDELLVPAIEAFEIN